MNIIMQNSAQPGHLFHSPFHPPVSGWAFLQLWRWQSRKKKTRRANGDMKAARAYLNISLLFLPLLHIPCPCCHNIFILLLVLIPCFQISYFFFLATHFLPCRLSFSDVVTSVGKVFNFYQRFSAQFLMKFSQPPLSAKRILSCRA